MMTVMVIHRHVGMETPTLTVLRLLPTVSVQEAVT
nr:MAG TPA: hypothetical protein [Caudoviricetes sp.]